VAGRAGGFNDEAPTAVRAPGERVHPRWIPQNGPPFRSGKSMLGTLAIRCVPGEEPERVDEPHEQPPPGRVEGEARHFAWKPIEGSNAVSRGRVPQLDSALPQGSRYLPTVRTKNDPRSTPQPIREVWLGCPVCARQCRAFCPASRVEQGHLY